MRLGTAVLGAGLLILLAGCGDAGSTSTRPRAATTQPAEPSSDVHDQQLLDCGTHVLTQGEPLGDEAMTCFLDAVAAGRPVQLEQTSPTTEGDPVTVLFRALGEEDEIELTIDATQDRFGSGRIEHQICSGVTRGEFGFEFGRCGP